MDLFGPRYGLPKAISGHQNYFYWGPRGYTGESVIVMERPPEELERSSPRCAKVGHVEHPYSMPYEHFDVFYCRGIKYPAGRVLAESEELALTFLRCAGARIHSPARGRKI